MDIWCRYYQMQKNIFKSDNDEDCDVWCGLFWMLLQSFEFEYLNTNMNMIKDRRCYCDIWGKYLISNTNIKKHGKDFDFDFDADYFEWGCWIWRYIFSQYMKNTRNRNTNSDKNDNDEDCDSDADYSECCCRVWRNIFLYMNKYYKYN